MDTLELLGPEGGGEAAVPPPALPQEGGEVGGLLRVGGVEAQHYLQGALSPLQQRDGHASAAGLAHR